MLHPDLQHKIFKEAMEERRQAAKECWQRQNCFSRPSRAEIRLGLVMDQLQSMKEHNSAEYRPVLVEMAK